VVKSALESTYALEFKRLAIFVDEIFAPVQACLSMKSPPSDPPDGPDKQNAERSDEDRNQLAVALPESALAAMPLFPLPSTVFFPGVSLPLNVFEARYRALVSYAIEEGQGALAVPLLKPGYEKSELANPPIHAMMGAGVIVEHTRLPDGRFHILICGTDRVRVCEELPLTQGFRRARVERVPDRLPERTGQGGEDKVVTEFELAEALRRELGEQNIALRQLAMELISALPNAKEALIGLLKQQTGCLELAHALVSRMVPDPLVRQRLLEEDNPLARVQFIQEAMSDLLLRFGSILNPGESLN